MKEYILSAALAFSAVGGVSAQDSADQCAAIDDSAGRLICYDLLFRVDRTEALQSTQTNWKNRTDTSRIDDSTNVFLSLRSSDDFPSRFGGGMEHGYMLVRCMENTTTVYFSMGEHHLADLQSYGRVTYRIDSAPAQSRRFLESTDNRALGLWNGGSSIPFIQELFGAENLLVQITPYGESAITVDFPIAGLEEAIKPLREACHW